MIIKVINLITGIVSVPGALSCRIAFTNDCLDSAALWEPIKVVAYKRHGAKHDDNAPHVFDAAVAATLPQPYNRFSRGLTRSIIAFQIFPHSTAVRLKAILL